MTAHKDKKTIWRAGFSLAEMLAALVISVMVLVSVLGMYRRAQSTAGKLEYQLENRRMVNDVLQRIAEDLDEVVSDHGTVTITADNKSEQGYNSARLIIEKSIYNKSNNKQTFEKIIWQTNTNFQTDTPGLILYRSHSGAVTEDKLLDRSKQQWQTEQFIPVCDGVTYFGIESRTGEQTTNHWHKKDALPKGLTVTISFAEPYEGVDGTWRLDPEQLTSRNIAVDRTRKIQFDIIEREFDDLYVSDVNDVNGMADSNRPDDGEVSPEMRNPNDPNL